MSQAARAWYQDYWKLVIQPDGYRELYDLERDPGELDNLAREPHYRDKLPQMQQWLYDVMRESGDGSLLPVDG